jgi:hypothetical protein
MNRVRWLNAQWPSSMRTIGNKLKGMPFTEENVDGFTIERIRDEFIEGKFIEKFVYQESISTSFGDTEVVERTGYRSTDFTLHSNFPQVELRNGPRSIKEFVNRLLHACNFNLVVTPVTIPLFDWVASLQKIVEAKLVVDSLQISGIELERGVNGKILLKGDKDVRDAVEHIVSGKRYTLEKVQIKIATSSQRVSIHLANNGCAKYPAECAQDFLPLLRTSIPKI